MIRDQVGANRRLAVVVSTIICIFNGTLSAQRAATSADVNPFPERWKTMAAWGACESLSATAINMKIANTVAGIATTKDKLAALSTALATNPTVGENAMISRSSADRLAPVRDDMCNWALWVYTGPYDDRAEALVGSPRVAIVAEYWCEPDFMLWSLATHEGGHTTSPRSWNLPNAADSADIAERLCEVVRLNDEVDAFILEKDVVELFLLYGLVDVEKYCRLLRDLQTRVESYYDAACVSQTETQGELDGTSLTVGDRRRLEEVRRQVGAYKSRFAITAFIIELCGKRFSCWG